MYHTILVPLDGTARSETALPVAGRLAVASGASVHLLVVHRWMQAWRPVRDIRETIEEMDAEVREQKAVYVRARATRLGRLIRRPVRAEIRDGFPTPKIVEYAEQEHCDLIVIASHRRGGLSRYFSGSVTDRLLRETSSPVLVLPSGPGSRGKGPPPPFRHALVALDGSAAAEAALAAALELVCSLGECRLTLFMAVGPDPAFSAVVSLATGRAHDVSAEEHLRCAEQYLAHAARDAAAAGVEIACVSRIAEDPASAILECVTDMSADLVVLGTRGLSGMARAVLGSVADRVVRSAHVPALVVGPRTRAAPFAHGPGGPSAVSQARAAALQWPPRERSDRSGPARGAERSRLSGPRAAIQPSAVPRGRRAPSSSPPPGGITGS